MKTYLISYDLIAPTTINDYHNIINAIKSFNVWAKPLESVWLIKTDLSAMQVSNYLTKYVRPKDKIIIMHVDNDWVCYNADAEIINWMRGGL